MSRQSVTKILSSQFNLDKHTEELDNCIEKFNKILSLPYLEVKKLENEFISDISLEKLNTIIEFLSIAMYYFDNNYHTQLNNFLQKVQPNKSFFSIDSYIKNFDKTTQFYIKSRFLPLDIYISFFKKKEKTPEIFNAIPKKFSKYLADLQNISKELIENNANVFFSVINTYLSYLNYFLPFIIVSQNNDLLAKYLEEAQRLLEILLINVEIKKLPSLKKVVLISNLKFLNYLAKILGKKSTVKYTDYLPRMDNINIKYQIFLLDYAKLQIISGKLLDINFDFPCFIDLLDKKDLYSKVSFLEDYAGHLTVKNFSHLLKSYLQGKDKTSNGKIYMAVNYYSDLLVEYLTEYVKNLSIDEFSLAIKFILIKLLNLEAVDNNLKVNLKIENLNKYIKYTSTKSSNKNYPNLIFSGKYNFLSIDIKIEVYSNINPDKTNHKFMRRKINKVIDSFFNKIDKLNLFINNIELKIKKLSKHPETVLHMERVGKVMFILLDELQEEKKLLTNISNNLSLKFEDFLKILGYLHDIGKADNLHNMVLYEKFNGRVFAIQQLLFILNNVLEGEQIRNLPEEEKAITFDKNDINTKNLYLLEEMNPKIKNIIKNHFLDIFTPDKYIINSIIPLLKNQLFFTVGEIFKYIQENTNIKNVNILSSSKEKKILVKKLNNYFKKNFIYLDFKLTTKNIDLFIFSLFVFLQTYSSMAQKKLTIPHIIYGMHFFQSHPEFNYLSWVLLHHKTYPSINEMKKYELFKGLKKFYELAQIDTTILDKYQQMEEGVFDPKDKDIYTALISTADLIDALLGGRKYQNIFDIDAYHYILKIFNKEFLKFIKSQAKREDFTDKDKVFEKIIKILDNEFSENKNWPKIKQVLLKKREEILSFYK